MGTPAPAPDPYLPAPPPTQDELPYEDGEPMETPKHRQQMALLIETALAALRDRPDVFVGGNMAVYFSAIGPHPQFKAPDFFVVLDVEPRERRSWVIWEEGGRTPDVIVELLSDSTAAEDRGRKMRLYAHARVPEYFLFDPHSLLLEGYALDTGPHYRRMEPLQSGRLPCEMLGLHLGLWEGEFERRHDTWLRWYTPDGQLVLRPAEAERARAEAEQSRAERLAAKLRAMGVDPDGA